MVSSSIKNSGNGTDPVAVAAAINKFSSPVRFLIHIAKFRGISKHSRKSRILSYLKSLGTKNIYVPDFARSYISDISFGTPIAQMPSVSAAANKAPRQIKVVPFGVVRAATAVQPTRQRHRVSHIVVAR